MNLIRFLFGFVGGFWPHYCGRKKSKANVAGMSWIWIGGYVRGGRLVLNWEDSDLFYIYGHSEIVSK